VNGTNVVGGALAGPNPGPSWTEIGTGEKQVVTGHFAYYAVPTNSRALSAFRHYVTDLWRRTLRRRSQNLQ
jgi:hypothetical protein